jgi:hypothetical protein
MSTVDEVLSTLNGLSEADRTWILGRLSSKEKARLLDKAPIVSPRPEAPARSDSSAALDAFDVAAVAEVLRHEPRWVSAALLFARDDAWSRALLKALPASLCADVEKLLRGGGTYTRALVDAVEEQALAHLTSGETVRSPSRFESLIQRFASARAMKRVSTLR